MPDHPAAARGGSLVGRNHEQATLRDALAAALAGRGSLVLIGGEAGIGKTALADALLAEARTQGTIILTGRCYDLTETPPYGPWAEVFGRAPRGDGLPAPPDLAGGAGATSQAALFAAVQRALAALAAQRPLVLLLDDLHWADPASLDLLRVLGRGLADLPVLLLATYRSDELTRRHPLYTLLPLLVREARAERLDLRPLDDDGLRSFVAAHALPPGDTGRIIDYLVERSEGNPFFAGELLRALEEAGTLRRNGGAWALGDLAAAGVPPLLRQVIDARIDRLGEDGRDLLAVAAVAGQEVPLALWSAVAESREDALLPLVERAVTARVLVETGDGAAIRFAHALIREALYEGMLAARRRSLHRRVAETLIATLDPDPDAVAHHFQRAWDDRALPWLLAAGERAQRAYALLTAAARYEAALALLERQGAPAGERCWLLLTIARLRRYADPSGATRPLEEALALAREAGDTALVGIALGTLGTVLCAVGRWRAGVRSLAEGVAVLEQVAPADVARHAVRSGAGAAALQTPRGVWMQAAAQAGHHADVLAFAAHWASMAEPPREPSAQVSTYADGWFGLGIAHAMTGQPEAAEAAFARALDTYRVIGHHSLVVATARAALLRIALPYRADQPAACERWARVMAEGYERGAGAMPGVHDEFRAPLDLLQGRWDAESFARLEAAVAARPRTTGTACLARRALARGERERVWDWVRRALPDGPGTAPGDNEFHDAVGLEAVAAALSLDGGDLPAARDWLAAHDRWLAWGGAVLGRAEGQLGWAAYHRAADDLAAAREHAERALAHAAEPRQPLARLAAHRLLGELDTAAGQHASASTHLAAALALADACAAPHERALILLALAELRAAEHQSDAADAALAEARAILAPLAARPALARADALAARLAAPATAPDPPRDALPCGLSAREVEVLRLVAEGLTNAQVAERLFVTPRTVNAHLTGIYAKLGVEGRAAAIRRALDLGLA